jgi:hypothetical protein
MDEKNYDFINPQHYRNYSFETLEMMQTIYGKEATAQYCEMSAFKYRMRMGAKPGSSVEQDLEKEKWFLNKAKELQQTEKTDNK